MQNLKPDYIVGLVDGEGSFTIYVRNIDSLKETKRRVVVEPKFYVKLIEKDKEILYSLQKFFGCGVFIFKRTHVLIINTVIDTKSFAGMICLMLSFLSLGKMN